MSDRYDQYRDVGESDSLVPRQYHPKPVPTPEDDARKALSSRDIPIEVFTELKRRMKAMPRGSAERKRGIVEMEHEGENYGYDRYGEWVGQGFEPNRNRGPAANALKYFLNKRTGGLDRNVASQERQSRDETQERAEGMQRYQIGEDQDRYAVDTYNKWLRQSELDEASAADRSATADYRGRVLDQGDQKLGLLRNPPESPLDAARARYYDAYASNVENMTSQNRPRSGSRAGDPTYSGTKSIDLYERRNALSTQIADIQKGVKDVASLPDNSKWWPGKPNADVTMYDNRGAYDENIDTEGRADYLSRYGAQPGTGAPMEGGTLAALINELRAIDTEIDLRGEGGAAGLPIDTPTPTGGGGQEGGVGDGATTPEAAPGGTNRAGIVAQSGMSQYPPNPVTIPSEQEWPGMSQEDQAFFNALLILQQEGADINSVEVQQEALRNATEARGFAPRTEAWQGPSDGL